MNKILTNDDLYRVAPSIFATEPYKGVSDRYTFIPTIGIVDALRNEGFFPVSAAQSNTRIDGKREFTKHMLRFRRPEEIERPRVVNGNAHHFYKEPPEIAELVLVNSHDRSSGYQLSAGILVQLCSNGLTVRGADIGDISVRHSGNIADEVIEGSYSIIEEMPLVMEHIDTFRGIQLKPEQQLAFAEAALALRYPPDEHGNQRSPIKPHQLLAARRKEDNDNNLWKTFNRVQENFMKGGLKGVATTGRRTRTRKIGSVNEDLRLNKALWFLTEKMAELA